MDHPTSMNSKVSQELARLLKDVEDDSLGLSPCVVGTGDCPLAPGIEHMFVSYLAHEASQKLCQPGSGISYPNVIYCPHTTIEKKCGFDISIGHFRKPHRVRVMHKLLNRRGKAKWCDESWDWKSTDDKQSNYHLAALLKAYDAPEPLKEKGRYEPFLCIHVCYCIHEFRRMGSKEAQIPDFYDPRRTVVVDLRKITEEVPKWQSDLLVDASPPKRREKWPYTVSDKVQIFVSFDATNDEFNSYLKKDSEVLCELPVWPVAKLLEHSTRMAAKVE